MSLVVRDPIVTIRIPIVMGPTFGEIIDMITKERCMHHLYLIRSMVVLYVLVEMNIGVIVQISLPSLCKPNC